MAYGDAEAVEKSERKRKTKRTRGEGMSDHDLVRVLRDEEADAASYYTSELAAVQTEAMERYHARPYGDEAEGRSKVVTHDIEDAINWVMPHLMRLFKESDELITCDDPGLDDGDTTLKQAADYLHHVAFQDNDGDTAIHDFVFDGLLQRIGVMRLYWRDEEPSPPREIEGITPDQIARYVQDPQYEILEAEQEEEVGTFALKVVFTPSCGRAVMEAVPPEEFRVSRRARSLAEADYHGWKQHVFLSEVLKDYPEKRAQLDPEGSLQAAEDDDIDLATDGRVDSRFPDEPRVTGKSSSNDDPRLGRKKVYRHVEYIRTDYDGDGIMELRRICRVGSVILENDTVEETEFVAWSPIRVSHRLIGRSLADTLLDLQKIRTVLTRATLDSLSRSLMPRTVVNEQAMASDGSTVERLLDHDVGGVVVVKGDVRAAFAETVTPDVSPQALTAMEFFDRKAEEASGVNKHAQGISPDAITKTASGIEMLQAAANSRIEQVARWAGKGLEEVFEKLLRLLVRHQDGARQVKISGKRIAVDPRRWGDEMTVSVHIGMAADSRDKKLMSLNMLAAKQEQLLLHAGPSNPVATLKHLRNTYAMMADTMGFRNPSHFFGEIPDNYQPPPPGPDPKMAEVQGKMQLAQADMQGKAQLAQADHQLKTQETQAKLQMSGQEAQAKLQQGQAEAQARLQLMREEAAAQIQLMREKAAAELQLARDKAAAEMELERERMASQERVSMRQAEMKGEQDARMSKNREGGRLDA